MVDYHDIWYRSGDGLRLYARDYPCRDEAITAPGTLLCMHGLTRNSADFAELAEHLSQRYRVIAVDVRGRGRSDYDPDPGNYHPLTYVQDMFSLLDQLELQQVILCGTSMGGLMSLMMSAMQGQRVRAVIINDIGPEVDPRGLERIRSYVGKTSPVSNWQEAVAQSRAINGIAFPDFSDSQWQAFTRGLYRDVDGVPVLAYDPAISQPMDDSDSAAVPPDLWPVFDAMSARPLLVIRGVDSDILAPGCVQEMQRRKPDLQVAEIPHRGHAPTLNESTARSAIDAFLESL